MKPWKVFIASLAALACAWVPVRAHAAEPSGPVTLAVANSCPALATAGVAAPLPLLPLLSPASLAAGDTSHARACGPCSQPVCVGKPLNSFCFGAIRLCQQVTVCSTTAAIVPLCECLSPP